MDGLCGSESLIAATLSRRPPPARWSVAKFRLPTTDRRDSLQPGALAEAATPAGARRQEHAGCRSGAPLPQRPKTQNREEHLGFRSPPSPRARARRGARARSCLDTRRRCRQGQEGAEPEGPEGLRRARRAARGRLVHDQGQDLEPRQEGRGERGAEARAERPRGRQAQGRRRHAGRRRRRQAGGEVLARGDDPGSARSEPGSRGRPLQAPGLRAQAGRLRQVEVPEGEGRLEDPAGSRLHARREDARRRALPADRQRRLRRRPLRDRPALRPGDERVPRRHEDDDHRDRDPEPLRVQPRLPGPRRDLGHRRRAGGGVHAGRRGAGVRARRAGGDAADEADRDPGRGDRSRATRSRPSSATRAHRR